MSSTGKRGLSKLESDFAGEFGNVRRSGLRARPEHLISSAVPSGDDDNDKESAPVSDVSPRKRLPSFSKDFKLPKLIKLGRDTDSPTKLELPSFKKPIQLIRLGPGKQQDEPVQKAKKPILLRRIVDDDPVALKNITGVAKNFVFDADNDFQIIDVSDGENDAIDATEERAQKDDVEKFFDATSQVDLLNNSLIEQLSPSEKQDAKGNKSADLVTDTEQLKQKILPKLHGKSDQGPYELDDKVQELYGMIHTTVKEGGQHSCLICGARNSGKTSALNAALRKAREDLDEGQDFIVIHINGLVQNNDSEAVRAIADQMDSEIARIYNVNLRELQSKELISRKSITNTFANILQVLDKELLLTDGQTAKISHPIIFCVDETDVFANQNKQTLLYNLFDLVQNSSTPICVLMFSTNFTVKELFEKRVRSRFSQRTLNFTKLPLEKFLTVGKKLLQVDEPSNDLELEWNRNIETLINTNTKVRRILSQIYLTTGNIKEFQNSCVYPVSMFIDGILNDADFAQYLTNEMNASLSKIVNSLSELELFLLVSAARVIAKTDMSWVNMNITYEEYTTQVKARSRDVGSSTGQGAVSSIGYKLWAKDSAKSQWESLIQLGLLTKPTQQGKSDFDSGSFETRMWSVELTLDELRLLVNPDSPAKAWTRL